jgi:hypothetical protein
MLENDEKSYSETDAAVAVASILLNLLIILVLSTGFWLCYSIISAPGMLGALSAENLWR